MKLLLTLVLLTLVLLTVPLLASPPGWSPAELARAQPTEAVAGGGSSTLDDGLTAYWKLDEASGTRVDSGANGQDLTDNNSTGSATGKINLGGDFEFASLNYLSHADSATLSLGADTDFTFSCWVNLESKPAFSGGIICKNGDAGDAAEYLLRWDAGDSFIFAVGTGSANQLVAASTLGAPSLATWYFIVCWHDSTANTVNIQVNNGTADNAAWSGGTVDGGNEYRIGAYSFNPGFAFDGIIDEVGFWKRVLTADERTELYNAGAGKTCCPF